ncbi:MAG: glycosyltransferase [Terriglobales bacterium]
MANDVPIGRWTSVERQGGCNQLLAVSGVSRNGARPLVPARLSFYAGLTRYRRQILKASAGTAIVGCPEALLAVSGWGWRRLIYQFHGVANPLTNPRYPAARLLAGAFEAHLFRALRRATAVIAYAAPSHVQALIARSRGVLHQDGVLVRCTCADTTVFFPADREIARTSVGIPIDRPVFVSCGRISALKGWPLVLQAFALLLRKLPEAALWFVGDGEDRQHLESEILNRGLTRSVCVTGFRPPHEVAAFLNAADVVVLGSHTEGWPTAIVEALSCGTPVVSTDVSGAREMIRDGENGFVIDSRDPIAFASAIARAMDLPNAREISLSIASQFGVEKLKEEFASVCPELF